MNIQEFSHKRYNILTGEWVLVSPHRAKRQWQGQEEENLPNKRSTYDPSCYLCVGNTRATGVSNPLYEDVFVFDNDFAALQQHSERIESMDGLLKIQSEVGICKVICFSPDHSKSLAQMDVKDIKKVVSVWKQEYGSLGSKNFINYVQIFENKGAIMGCSNPHPHGQIWSQSTVPNEVLKKDHNQKTYFKEKQRSLLREYLDQELIKNERIVFENKDFVVVVPFWAIWPFETMIVPKKHQNSILEMTNAEELRFAESIAVITSAYDKIFDCSFPYSSGIHQAPTTNNNNEHWHWHMNFYPPLLRSSTVKKFMVGYEMFCSPQRDLTPEQAVRIIKKKCKQTL